MFLSEADVTDLPQTICRPYHELVDVARDVSYAVKILRTIRQSLPPAPPP